MPRLTHVDGAGEDLRLGENGKTVRELSYVVVCLGRLSVDGLHILEWHGGVVLVGRESSGASINGVEHSVEDAWTYTASNSETLVLQSKTTSKQLCHFLTMFLMIAC